MTRTTRYKWISIKPHNEHWYSYALQTGESTQYQDHRWEGYEIVHCASRGFYRVYVWPSDEPVGGSQGSLESAKEVVIEHYAQLDPLGALTLIE